MADSRTIRGRNKKAPSTYERMGKIPYVALPLEVINCDEYKHLKGNSIKLLACMASQYKTHKPNNGALCATENIMKKFGIAPATGRRSLDELLESKMIIKTRQGGKNYCSYYAVTWLPIDECYGRNLVVSPTNKPPIDYYGRNRKRENERKNKTD